MKRVIKRILVTNRSIVRQITPFVFMFGIVFMMALGIGIISGNPIKFESSLSTPYGYLLLYGSCLIFISYSVELFRSIAVSLFRFLKQKRGIKGDLAARIKQVEQGG